MSGGYHKAALYAATEQIGTARGALHYRLHGDGSIRDDGSDFLSGFTSDFGSQITITKNTWKNPNWVTVKVKVAKTASPGGRIVTITNPNTEFDTFCCFTVN